MGQTVVDPKGHAGADDLSLGHVHKRRHQFHPSSLDASAGAQTRGLLHGAQPFGPAVGIPRRIEHVDSQCDALGAQDLGHRQRVSHEQGVARGHVGRGNPAAHLRVAAILGNRALTGERRAGNPSQIDLAHAMGSGAQGPRHACGCLQFHRVKLAVMKTQGVAQQPLSAAHGEHGGRVEPTRKQHDDLHGGNLLHTLAPAHAREERFSAHR